MTNKFYTLQEIHNLTHTSVIYLKKLIDNGKLKAYKLSKDYLITDYDFQRFLESMEVRQNDK